MFAVRVHYDLNSEQVFMVNKLLQAETVAAGLAKDGFSVPLGAGEWRYIIPTRIKDIFIEEQP